MLHLIPHSCLLLHWDRKCRRRKANRLIFEKAMETAGVDPDEVVHIGDSVTSDIEPALLLGITPIYISRKEPAVLDGVRVIRTLNEL